MFPYWLLFSVFAVASLFERTSPVEARRISLMLVVLFLGMAAMVGLRFQVGADYGTYIRIFDYVSRQTFDDAFEFGDPGYQFVNWLVGQWEGDMWHVNLICGAIFAWGLAMFCRRQPAPLLAALVAVPYLVVVVAMGYTRQAVAIGVIMAGLASLDRHASIARFVIYVAIASLFHKTALIALPVAIFAGRRNHLLNLVAIVLAGIGLYTALLDESVDRLVTNYLDARYASQGAAIRVAMNAVPAAMLLLAGQRLGLTEYQLRLWRIFAILALLCIPALALSPSSTAVDRVALYLIPVQMVAIARLPILLRSEMLGRVAVAAYSFAVLFVWLNYAAHSSAWIPYRLAV